MDKQSFQSNLIEAIQIGIDVANFCITKNITSEKPIIENVDSVELYNEWISEIKSKKVSKSALKFYENDFFIYYNEASGEQTELFWEKIRESGLPFKRKNLLEKILKKKKINKREEYDYVNDTMIPLYQNGDISEDELNRLKQMVGDYENNHKE